jgi:hypothetical protein
VFNECAREKVRNGRHDERPMSLCGVARGMAAPALTSTACVLPTRRTAACSGDAP